MFFLFDDFHNLQKKKDFMRNDIFFSVGSFFFGLFIFSPTLPILSPSKRTRDDEGFIFYTCRVTLRPRICPINHTLNTGRDSVDSPSGCKVKTLMYSTFANELVCLRNCFFCFNSLLIDSQQLCVFIM